MGLLTIGEFARAARLTPKALRLYDGLGLLPPAAVDPESGYRLYDPEQLERARLIAQLRRIGMPLAEIGTVCGLEPAAAADAVTAYWQRVSAETAARGRLATSLVDHLSGRATTMNATIALRCAARSETGLVRPSNQDAAYAGDRLVAVADGGGGARGAAASAGAVGALRSLELVDAAPAELLAGMAEAVAAIDQAVRAEAGDDEEPITTLTALVRSGSQLALVHVGDTRAYLLRDGELVQLTHDHTYVQMLVDQGKLGTDEAATHPQRSLLVRALGAGGRPVEADLALRSALPGDRYLLCSDGLHAVVDRAALHAALSLAATPEEIVGQLVELAHTHGAPDNIACVVADVVAV